MGEAARTTTWVCALHCSLRQSPEGARALMLTGGGALEHVLVIAGEAADVGRGAAHVEADHLHALVAALPLGRQGVADIPADGDKRLSACVAGWLSCF